MPDKKYDEIVGEYKYGFKTEVKNVVDTGKGLSEEVIRTISKLKNEPEWMLEFRLKSYKAFLEKENPTWGPDLSEIDFNDYTYFIRSSEKTESSWDEVPEAIKDTFDKLGIPEAERKSLAGVGAQYDSEVVYHSMKEELIKQKEELLALKQSQLDNGFSLKLSKGFANVVLISIITLLFSIFLGLLIFKIVN